MNLNSIVFPDSLPSLDLHGYDRESARVAILDFIKDNKVMKRPFLVVVHGVGSGIIRKVTLETLRNNKNVLDFKLLNGNNGCTIVQIKV